MTSAACCMLHSVLSTTRNPFSIKIGGFFSPQCWWTATHTISQPFATKMSTSAKPAAGKPHHGKPTPGHKAGEEVSYTDLHGNVYTIDGQDANHLDRCLKSIDRYTQGTVAEKKKQMEKYKDDEKSKAAVEQYYRTTAKAAATQLELKAKKHMEAVDGAVGGFSKKATVRTRDEIASANDDLLARYAALTTP